MHIQSRRTACPLPWGVEWKKQILELSEFRHEITLQKNQFITILLHVLDKIYRAMHMTGLSTVLYCIAKVQIWAMLH